MSRRYIDLKPRPAPNASAPRLGRRTVLKGAAALAGVAAGSGAVTGFPTILAQTIKNITLRQFGTGVSAYNDIAVHVKKDLCFTMELSALGSGAGVQRAVTQ